MSGAGSPEHATLAHQLGPTITFPEAEARADPQFWDSIDPDKVEAARRLLEISGVLEITDVQYDVSTVFRKLGKDKGGEDIIVEASACLHDCTTDPGEYDCPAARSLNGGILLQTMAPPDRITSRINTEVKGIVAAECEYFKDGGFREYCQAFSIPRAIAVAIREILHSHKHPRPRRLNMFGGDTDLYPKLPELFGELTARGYIVEDTTTGSGFMHAKKGEGFLEGILANPPDVIVLSADDVGGPEGIQRLASLSLSELEDARRAANTNYGQRFKAIEAIYVARLAQELAKKGIQFPPIRFNVVLHKGNLDVAEAMAEKLTTLFPGTPENPTLVNVFPAQTAFDEKESDDPGLSAEHADSFQSIVDRMLARQAEAIWHGRRPDTYVANIHYWILLKSFFMYAGEQRHLSKPAQDELAMRMVAGYDGWTCFKNPKAGGCQQLGVGQPGRVGPDKRYPGGTPGCYWNKRTVTNSVDTDQMTVDDAKIYITIGKKNLSMASAEQGCQCPGCTFPRLVGNMITANEGMLEALRVHYISLRRQYLGF